MPVYIQVPKAQSISCVQDIATAVIAKVIKVLLRHWGFCLILITVVKIMRLWYDSLHGKIPVLLHHRFPVFRECHATVIFRECHAILS